MKRMFPRLLRSFLLLCLLGGSGIVLARGIGAGTDDLSPGGSRLTLCALPCWMRLTPRGSTVSNADVVLTSIGYIVDPASYQEGVVSYLPVDPPQQCVVEVHYIGSVIEMLILKNCPDIRLGDVFAAAGTPDSVFASGNALAFANFTVIAAVEGDRCRGWLSPYSRVTTLRLVSTERALQDTRRPWRGFMPYWRYLQVQPDVRPPDCP